MKIKDAKADENLYRKPVIHVALHIGPLPNNEIASLLHTEIQEFFKMNDYNKDTTLYKINPSFMLREIGDESVLVPVGDVGILNNSIISLNETSSFLWKQFSKPSTIQDVIFKTKEEYSDLDNRIEEEVEEFVNTYLEVKLLMEV